MIGGKINKSSSTLKNTLRKNNKKEHFKRTRMWMYYFSSQFAKDRGKIPSNIGNRILISNNMYITQLYLSSVIQVEYLSLQTPITLIELLTRYLRSRGCHCVVDGTWKNSKLNMSVKDDGLGARMNTWEKAMSNPMLVDKYKESAARCLYTANLLTEGESLKMSRMYITLRTKLGSELTEAESRTFEFLEAIGAEYRLISPVKETLSYIAMLSNKKTQFIKDYKSLCFSNKTFSQIMPNTASHNGYKGLWLGNNILNNSHYFIPLEDITEGRTILLVAPSGVGKSVILGNTAANAVENPKWRVCLMDIKGNEYTKLAKSSNGLIVSLTPRSKFYLNCWRMDSTKVSHEDAVEYFNNNVNFCKNKMITLSGAADKETLNEERELLEDFYNFFYNSIGVRADNKNSWHKTKDLTPFSAYESLEEYITPAIVDKYPLASKKLINGLRPYMSKGGSKSYIFKEEFDMNKILQSKLVVFNFGMLRYTEISQIDQDLFDSRFDDMSKINSEYILYNYNHGFETLKGLEEAQIVPKKTMRKYVEEVTVRRSQRQSNIVACNSISAVVANDDSKALIENVSGILMGNLNKEAREEVIKQFDLEKYRSIIKLVGSNEYYKNSFVFINKMQPDALIPIIKLKLREKKKYLLFTPVKSIDGDLDKVESF